MATWPANPVTPPQQRRATEALLTEARVQTMLLCRIVTLLSLMAGPANYTTAQGWTPEDLTGDLDNLRSDGNLFS